MDIEYRSRKLENICTDYAKGCKAYGNKMAEKIYQRIREIRSADSIE